jgi:hypothetical protein
MATTAIPPVVARPDAVASGHTIFALERRGIGAWLTTPDHKKIGILYMVASFVFFLLAGLAALLVRVQLALPEAPPFAPELYNQLFTIHASAMIFLFIIPFGVGGLGNYFVPLMIGARDMAFPKINALSFWMILPAGLLILSGFFFVDPSSPPAPPTPAGRRTRRSARAARSGRAYGSSGSSSWAPRRFSAR